MIDENKRELLSRRDLKRVTGLPMSTVYAWMAKGLFPAPLKLGPQRVAWRVSDVEAWLASRQRKAA